MSTVTVPVGNCSSRWILVADICNRGPATAPTGLSGTFYLGEPGAGGQKICTGETEGALAPGACTLVKCEYADPPTGPIDLWFVADDDGSGGGTVIECKEQNNPMHMAQIVCPGKID